MERQSNSTEEAVQGTAETSGLIEELKGVLGEALLQLEYLEGRFDAGTGSGEAVKTKLREAIAKCDSPREKSIPVLQAIQIAEDHASYCWDKFKRGFGPERGNPYWDGKSDGATDVADKLKEL